MPNSMVEPVRGLTLNPYSLAKYVDPLPIPALASPAGTRAGPGTRRRGFRATASRCGSSRRKFIAICAPTTFWGYDGMSPGPTFEARSGQPLIVEWVNQLAHAAPAARRPDAARRGIG